jgi:capsular polysaccharide export protein
VPPPPEGRAAIAGRAGAEALLRIPPFPGTITKAFKPVPPYPAAAPPDELRRSADLLRQHRVGGTFWAAQPALQDSYLLVRSRAAAVAAAGLRASGEVLLWLPAADGAGGSEATVVGECDPWHMLSRAKALVVEGDDETGVIAALLGVPTYRFDRNKGGLTPDERGAEAWLAEVAAVHGRLADPFSGEPIGFAQAVELCGFWRRLIDSNRSLGGGLGFAFWKQQSVAPLLWNGRDDFAFLREVPSGLSGPAIAVWRSKAPEKALAALEERGLELVEVEDGFLRSSGLGADCVPPLSITVDGLGAHFDPRQPSGLELLLQDGVFDEALVARARRLRETIVAEGLGKYDRAKVDIGRPGGGQRHVLVPGQVEDDRSVITGGCGLTSNLELLRRVREREPTSYLLYKPHPDVVAGHRVGDIPDHVALRLADAVVADTPISALLDMVDAVHVNTSLAGFEGLMRGKEVVTHGVPFYSGWGLTTDLGPVPVRRTARRTVDELVAATLLLYPRYLDPVSGLPCPAETVVGRLCSEAPKVGMLPVVRRLQGRLKRSLRVLVR